MRPIERSPTERSQTETLLLLDPLDPSGTAWKALLASDGRTLHGCSTGQEALNLLPNLQPDLVVASLETIDLPGTRVIQAFRSRAPRTPVIALSSHPTVEGAILALQAGATDYLGRPLSPGLVREKVGRALSAARTSASLAAARAQSRERYGVGGILSQSPRMGRVMDQIRSVAPTEATVLIRGETGTGKEVVARAIHETSKRKGRPMISVNCGAFTETLLESELFGHEKGSFTGAVGRRQGVFELADGGTLFLDELGETSLNVQVNLLRVLEEMRFRRVGGTEPVEVDVRIIAATNVNLESAVKDKAFREDLFYRLNVFPLTLPPLRERPEDIPILLQHFLEDAAREYTLPIPQVAPEAREALLRYRWPGNVRQLRAMAERWVILCAGKELRMEHLPSEFAASGEEPGAPGAIFVDDSVPLQQWLDRVVEPLERVYLHRLLGRHRGALQVVAAAAGITRRTLYTRMKKLGLDAQHYK